jgi:hypothetical protein
MRKRKTELERTCKRCGTVRYVAPDTITGRLVRGRKGERDPLERARRSGRVVARWSRVQCHEEVVQGH